MAKVTTNVYLNRSGYVIQATPDKVTKTNASTAYLLNADNIYDYNRLYLGFDAFPTELRRQKLYCARLKVQLRDGSGSPVVLGTTGTFTASSLTWNTAPAYNSSVDTGFASITGSGSGTWSNVWINISGYDTSGSGSSSDNTRRLLARRGCYLYKGVKDSSDNKNWYGKIALKDGTEPYIEVTYDDAVKITSKPQISDKPYNADVRKAQTIKWTLEKNSTFSCVNEKWTQASAILYWRKSGASSWTTISVSGSTQSASIPAKTLPPGSTIEIKVKTTDTDGTTATSDTETFTTQYSTITPKTYPNAPVNPFNTTSFTWDFEPSYSGSTYTQKSAKLYWRKSGTSSWNSIAASGSTKSITVPAKTFPINATVEWYLTGVDDSGYESTSSTRTFTVPNATLALTTKPASSDIDGRLTQTFKWSLYPATASGNYTQASATLYYRVKNSGASFSTLTVSGNTKELTSPAYCFKAGQTIEYYLTSTTETSGGVAVTARTPTNYYEFTTLAFVLAITTTPQASNVDTRAGQTFSWTLKNVNGYDVTQQSAKLYWRVQGAASYNTISNNTSTKSITAAANTFPTSATIQWYVAVTAKDGSVWESSPTTFSTVSPKITATVFPSGSNIYTAAAIKFEWEFQSTLGKFGQKSAKLYWRASSSEAYKSIPASGTTQSLSVPALTFPTAATIQWYLEGVDSGGGTSTTNVASFTTVTPSIKATQYPTGSDVDTRLATVIKWEFQSPGGNYGQKSATFYWRVQGAVTYNAIAASGTTQQVSVPANTFPTSSTIQWYIAGVDSSNHSSQTSPTTFTTVTPQVKATEYPSGSDVYSGAKLTFKWKIESAAGDYAQKSAVFYWRSDTSQSYRAINVSGATTQIVVAANTFPTNKTVYWYVTAVDSSNHSSQTSVANFKTQTTQITPQSSPTSGYKDPRQAIKFQWYFKATGGSIPQSSATFYWKRSTDENYTAVQASGGTTSVTIAANTFPVASIIEWYVSGTDVGGTSSETSVYSFSTTAATAYAVVKQPINSGVDGSAPVTFEWTLVTADGRAPSRVVLEWKLPTETVQQFHTIVDTNNPITQYTVDAGYFPAGEINWRVTAYNVDAVIGPSSAASFICIIAPEVSAISATPVPFSTVSWQSSDQEAYQIYVDGKLYGPYFGTEKQFALPDYLRDGVHTIRVRVLGEVDLWSSWVETTVSVQNESQHEIEVQGYADVNVRLEWQTEAVTSDFLIYRDDKLIGHTHSNTFTDRYSLGLHDYYVVNRRVSGNYDKSEIIQRKTCVEYMCMEMPDGSIIVNIDHALKNSSDPTHDNSREITLLHQAGNRYSSLFKTGFYDETISCSAVFLYTEEKQHKEFQKLLGEAVIVKIKDGTCCLAAVKGWNRTSKKNYYTAYTLDLKRIEWEDYVDDTQ